MPYGVSTGLVYTCTPTESGVNLALVEGMAWAYKDTKDAALLVAEGDARREKRGLRRDKEPVPPGISGQR